MFTKVFICLLFSTMGIAQVTQSSFDNDLITLQHGKGVFEASEKPLFDLENGYKPDNRVRNILLTEAFVIGYGITDYILFNRLKWQDDTYRVFQGVLIAGCNYILYKITGDLRSPISFSFQLFTAVPDLVYYAFARDEWKNENSFTHLKFTPLGLAKKDPLNKDGVMFQGFNGIGIGIGINLFDL